MRSTGRSGWDSAFYEDALRYHPAGRRLQEPMTIFQGRFDESVSPALVEAFARRQPAASFHLLEDGHQLKDSLGFIWAAIAPVIVPGKAPDKPGNSGPGAGVL